MIFTLVAITLLPFLAGAVGLNSSMKGKGLNYLLSFSGAFLISTTFTHLIPEVYHHEESVTYVSLFILAGFFFQIVLENLSQGIEHGHFHDQSCGHRHNLPLVMFLSLFIHSFVEGGVLDEHFFHGDHQLITVGLSIAIHKIPVAFALMVLVKSTFPTSIKRYLLLVGFALSGLLGYYGLHWIPFIRHEWLIAFVSGMFLHVATTILFEVSPGHRFETKRLLIAILGAILAFLPELI